MDKKGVPKQLLEWAVLGNLNRLKDIDLILLKGHLYLDLALNSILPDKSLSFYGKTKKLKKKGASKKLVTHLLEINNLRNQLAHEYKFSASESSLSEWAERVLNDYEATFFTKKTFRTRILHAFSTLSKEILVLNKNVF